MAKPKASGYSAAYRSQLEQEFLGDDGKRQLNKAPASLRNAISAMLKEIENLRAKVAATDGRGANG